MATGDRALGQARRRRLVSAGAPEELTVTTAAVKLQAIPAGAKRALIFVGTNAVRWLVSTAPTATKGLYVAGGGYIDWTDPMWDYQDALAGLEFFLDTGAGGDAALVIQYFK